MSVATCTVFYDFTCGEAVSSTTFHIFPTMIAGTCWRQVVKTKMSVCFTLQQALSSLSKYSQVFTISSHENTILYFRRLMEAAFAFMSMLLSPVTLSVFHMLKIDIWSFSVMEKHDLKLDWSLWMWTRVKSNELFQVIWQLKSHEGVCIKSMDFVQMYFNICLPLSLLLRSLVAICNSNYSVSNFAVSTTVNDILNAIKVHTEKTYMKIIILGMWLKLNILKFEYLNNFLDKLYLYF